MSVFDKIKESLTSETLGEVEGANKPLPAKKKKKSKMSPQEIINPTNIKYPNTTEEKRVDIFNQNTHYPVLSMLHIEKDVDISTLITPDEVDNITFTITAPTGLNPDEVEQFCNLVQKDIMVYRNIIESRQRDFIKLLDEINSLEEKLTDQKQENELASFIIDHKNTEEQLKDKVVELQIENRELKSKLNKLLEHKDNFKITKQEPKKEPKKVTKMPTIGDDNQEHFDDVFDEIGGF